MCDTGELNKNSPEAEKKLRQTCNQINNHNHKDYHSPGQSRNHDRHEPKSFFLISAYLMLKRQLATQFAAQNIKFISHLQYWENLIEEYKIKNA